MISMTAAENASSFQDAGWERTTSSPNNSSSTSPSSPFTQPTHKKQPSRNAILSIQLAASTARDFDANFSLRNIEKEESIPLFVGTEIVLEAIEPCRRPPLLNSNYYFSEFGLKCIKIVKDLILDDSSHDDSEAQDRRHRLADRVLREEHANAYSVKYIRKNLINSDLGPQAACEMILETKILMNLSPSHPNLLQVYGANGDGIDSFLESGRKSFFLIIDRLECTLEEKIEQWRQEEAASKNEDQNTHPNGDNSVSNNITPSEKPLTKRLEVANDICSALVFLASRELVYYLRPDKVAFDCKSGHVKLCEFGQSRQEGMTALSPSLLLCQEPALLAYMAPEVLLKAPATVSSDVYAFGIVLWEMMSLQPPFGDIETKSDHLKRVIQNKERPPVPPQNSVGGSWPREICKEIQQCWDPHFRPTIKNVQDILEAAILFDDGEDEEEGSKETPEPEIPLCPSSPRRNDRERKHLIDEKRSQTPLTSVEQQPAPSQSTSTASVTSGASSCLDDGGKSSIDQHLKQNSSNEHARNNHASGNASVMSFRTLSCKFNKSNSGSQFAAFTSDPVSPTTSLAQQQRRRKSSSSSAAPSNKITSTRPHRRRSSAEATEPKLSEAAAAVEGRSGAGASVCTDRSMRPRRLSMEITKPPSRSVRRSQSMHECNGDSIQILQNALSRLPTNDSDSCEPNANSNGSTATPPIEPPSQIACEPAYSSPVQRRRSSRISLNAGSPAQSYCTSSTDEASPRVTTGTVPTRRRSHHAIATEKLRKLVHGESFPDPFHHQKHGDSTNAAPSCSNARSVPAGKNRVPTHGVQRSKSLLAGAPPPSPSTGVSKGVAVAAASQFSLDNATPTSSPTVRSKRSNLGVPRERKPVQRSRSASTALQNLQELQQQQQQLQQRTVNDPPEHSERRPVQRSRSAEEPHQPVNEHKAELHKHGTMDVHKGTDPSSPRRRHLHGTVSARDLPRSRSRSHAHNNGKDHDERRSVRVERTSATMAMAENATGTSIPTATSIESSSSLSVKQCPGKHKERRHSTD